MTKDPQIEITVLQIFLGKKVVEKTLQQKHDV
jgi:hypothetical protein